MNSRRHALKLLLAGLATCAATPVLAAQDIIVYYSPD